MAQPTKELNSTTNIKLYKSVERIWTSQGEARFTSAPTLLIVYSKRKDQYTRFNNNIMYYFSNKITCDQCGAAFVVGFTEASKMTFRITEKPAGHVRERS